MHHPLRVLPLTMLFAFLLLGIKVGEVVRDSRTLVVSFGEEARAQAPEAAKPSEALSPAAAGASPTATPPAGATPATTPPATAAGTGTDPKVTPPSTDPAADDAEPEEPPKHEYSQVEVDLLQSLAKRRQELDEWAKQIQLKDNMLIATEQRLNDKIDNLQKMKKELEALLALYNEQEDTKIRSLVKIYENMKPKDAARIFEELDMPVLLTVVDKMNERKVSPILAAMNPTKAKDVTVQLAEQRKLQKPRAGAAAAAVSAANDPATAQSPPAPASVPAAPPAATR